MVREEDGCSSHESKKIGGGEFRLFLEQLNEKKEKKKRKINRR